MPNEDNREKPNKEGKNGRSKATRRKGITIEDLKQQTALRLAKQQESRQRKNTRNNHKGKASSHNTAQSLTPTVPLDLPVYVPRLVVHSSSNIDPSNRSVQSSDASISNYSGYATHASYTSSSVPQGHGVGYNRNDRANCLQGSSYSVPVRAQKIPKLKQNLMHGLTVQELKEMTRARLANEATAEESESVTTTPITEDTSQYSFHRAMSLDEGVRQRVYSADSWRLSKAQSRWNPFVRSENDSGLLRHPPGISSFYSADAADSVSVNSFASGYGADSHLESDMGKSMSFQTEHDLADAYYDEQQQQLKVASSFEIQRPTSRVNGIGVPSFVLSNLVEGKPYPPDIAPSPSLDTDRQRYDFAGLPPTPALERTPFSDDALSDLLHRQSVTPSTMQTFSLSGEYPTPDVAQLHVPDLDHSPFRRGVSDRGASRSSDLPNSVAESVLGSSEDHFESEGVASGRNGNPWIENEENVLSKIEKDLNNLLLFENNGKCKDENIPFSSLESGWNPMLDSNHSPSRSFVNVVPENFNDDDVESVPVFTPDRRRVGDSFRSSPSKSSSKRSTSRWNFLSL